MGLPEPIEPQSGDDAPEPTRPGRADWLCGPEEGLEAELQSLGGAAPPAPRLVRPGAADAADPGDAPRADAPARPMPKLARPSTPDAPDPHLTLVPGGPAPKLSRPASARPEEPAEEAPVVPPAEPTVLWKPSGNSIPVFAHAAAPPAPAAPPLPVPAADLDFPMDDAEERALAKAAAAAAAEAAAQAEAGPPATQPHAVVTPEAFDIQDAPAPWWMQLPTLLREDRRAQALAGLVVVVLLAVAFWPRPEKSLPIGAIRRDAVRYDGQQVKIAGRVGEVFEVGGGHTFYLHQGRDTIVVFTRTRTPRLGDRVTVTGMVSTGFFNGHSGTAVFESATQ